MTRPRRCAMISCSEFATHRVEIAVPADADDVFGGKVDRVRFSFRCDAHADEGTERKELLHSDA